MADLPRLKIKLQLLLGDNIALGPGKAELLEWLERTGSISAAAKAMGLSYRRAWSMVDTMNRCFREPLVSTAHGGARGGGAALTDAGRNVLAQYRALQTAVAGAADPAILARLAEG
jgi:molybdate transport system regulatory protein